MKLTRGAFRTYVDTNFGSGTASWYVIGADIEDMSTELNPDTESVKNILDEVSFRHNGHEVSTEADPFYADPDDPLYPKLRDIAMGRKKGDDCKTKVLEVFIEDTSAASHVAWQEDCYIVPTSVGGDTAGVNIPFTINYAGNRQKGTVAIANKVPTFTPDAEG